MEKIDDDSPFLKALISAAWADGELSDGEIKTLSYYLQRFSIEDDEYEALKPLLIAPIDSAKAQALLEQQLEILTSPEDQRTLLAAVEDLLVVDNQLDPAEAEFLVNLRQLTSHLPTAQVFISRIKALWSPRPSRPISPERARGGGPPLPPAALAGGLPRQAGPLARHVRPAPRR